jgi:uncharacterized protein
LNIHIREIGPEGRHIRRELSDREVRRMLEGTGLDTHPNPSHVLLDLRLSRVQDHVLLSGRITGVIWTACRRCLGPVEIAVNEADLAHTFLPRAMLDAEIDTERELEIEDLDVSTHDGEMVDFGALVRECLILAVPIAPLCREACPGLQPEREADAGTMPAWKAALKQLKDS